MDGKVGLLRDRLNLEREIAIEDDRSLWSDFDPTTDMETYFVVVLVPWNYTEM